jgi:hypothetical protein
MNDLGDLHYFLGMAVRRSPDGLFLSQRHYALDILEHAGMTDCHSSPTPVDMSSKLSATDGDLLPEATDYMSLAWGLQYLTLTRPNISYAVQQICLHMHAPRTSHLAPVKRVLRYICGTLDFSLQLRASSSTTLTTYSDAEWVVTRVNSTNVLNEGLRIGEIGRRMNSKVKLVEIGVYRK